MRETEVDGGMSRLRIRQRSQPDPDPNPDPAIIENALTTVDSRSGAESLPGSDRDCDEEPARSMSTRWTPRSVAAVAAVTMLVPVGAVSAWLGTEAYRARETMRVDQQFMRVAEQTALNLANISSGSVEQDVQRIVDSSTGAFRDDFQQRVPSFIEFVKQAQSRSEATIRETALESTTAAEANVLVALAVKVTAADVPPDDPPRSWRMRLTVQRIDDAQMKVSNVEFVP